MTDDTHRPREDVLEYSPMTEEEIEDAARKAIALGKEHHKKVTFKLNNVSLTVDENSTPEDTVSTYFCEMSKQRDAYWASPDGKAEIARQGDEFRRDQFAREIARHQATMNRLVETELDKVLKEGMSATIRWVKKYALACNGTIDYKCDTVLKKLSAAGYKSNECTGSAFVKGDKDIMGRYIIGQVMHCIGSGPFRDMPLGAVAILSADEYAAMPDKTWPNQYVPPPKSNGPTR